MYMKYDFIWIKYYVDVSFLNIYLLLYLIMF